MKWIGQNIYDLAATFRQDVTIEGEIKADSLDIPGNIDVDGTTNLDVVDIDGSVDIATTLTVVGRITSESGVMFKQMTAPSNPSAGYAIMYMDSSDGALKVKVTGGEGTTTCTLCPTGEGAGG